MPLYRIFHQCELPSNYRRIRDLALGWVFTGLVIFAFTLGAFLIVIQTRGN